jgi:hypothetical protein
MDRINDLIVGAPDIPKGQIYDIIDHVSRVNPVTFQVRESSRVVEDDRVLTIA